MRHLMLRVPGLRAFQTQLKFNNPQEVSDSPQLVTGLLAYKPTVFPVLWSRHSFVTSETQDLEEPLSPPFPLSPVTVSIQ